MIAIRSPNLRQRPLVSHYIAQYKISTYLIKPLNKHQLSAPGQTCICIHCSRNVLVPHLVSPLFNIAYIVRAGLASRSGIVLNFLSNSTIALDHNLVEVLGRLDWVGLLIHPLQLLESPTLRFHATPNALAHKLFQREKIHRMGLTRRSTKRPTRAHPSQQRSRNSSWKCSADL